MNNQITPHCIVRLMDHSGNSLVVSWDRGLRRLVAAGWAAVLNGRGNPVVIVVPSWKEAREIRKLLELHFGESRRIVGEARWQPLEVVRGADVLVVTYQRFVNYVQFQGRCGFYRVVLHDVHRFVRGHQLYVLEALLERLRRLRQGFRVCCTASGLPLGWMEWFRSQFEDTQVIHRGKLVSQAVEQVEVLDCADIGLGEVIPSGLGRRCLVVPPGEKVEVEQWLGEEYPGVTVFGFGESYSGGGFDWVGVDLRRQLPEESAHDDVWSLVKSQGMVALLVDGDQLNVPFEEVRRRFVWGSVSSRDFGGGRQGVARDQQIMDLVLQVMRKVRYWRQLDAIFRSFFLFVVWQECFVQACYVALGRLMKLGLVSRPVYELASGRCVRAGWLRVTQEGRHLASDFTSLEVPPLSPKGLNFTALMERLAEWFDEGLVESVEVLHHWAQRSKPPPRLAEADTEEIIALERVYRSLSYIARVYDVAVPQSWEQIRHHLRRSPPSQPRVSDVVAVRRLAHRLAIHLILGGVEDLDVEPWRFFDPRELARLTGVPVGQAKRLLFGFFGELTEGRLRQLREWVERGWLSAKTLEQIRVMAENLERGYWRHGIGRPRTVLVCRQGV